MKPKSVFETGKPTEAQIREQISREFSRWNEIAANGCSDPFHEDGVNMDLTRNHILYWYRILHERGFTVRDFFGDYPYEKPVPPKVPISYMVKGGSDAGRLEQTRSEDDRKRIVWGYPGEYAL